jgi:inner membrane protein
MDILTHALLGAGAGLSLARLRSHARAAALAGAAGAVLPDVDVLIRSVHDPLLTVEYHRQFTHSFVMAPLGALFAAALAWLVLRRRIALAGLYAPALLGVLSHILLDVATSFGVQVFWPFSERRYALSIVAVVDPAVTITLLAVVVLALKTRHAWRAQAGLGIVALYLALGAVQQQRAADAIAATTAERGHTIERHEVKPTIGNLLLWRSVYDTGELFVVDAVRVGLERTVYPGGAEKGVSPSDFVPPLKPGSTQASDIERFARVSQDWLVRHPIRSEVIGDVRYAMLPDSTVPLWGIVIDPRHQARHVRFVTFREWTPEDRRRFLSMIRGHAPVASEVDLHDAKTPEAEGAPRHRAFRSETQKRE